MVNIMKLLLQSGTVVRLVYDGKKSHYYNKHLLWVFFFWLQWGGEEDFFFLVLLAFRLFRLYSIYETSKWVQSTEKLARYYTINQMLILDHDILKYCLVNCEVCVGCRDQLHFSGLSEIWVRCHATCLLLSELTSNQNTVMNVTLQNHKLKTFAI